MLLNFLMECFVVFAWSNTAKLIIGTLIIMCLVKNNKRRK